MPWQFLILTPVIVATTALWTVTLNAVAVQADPEPVAAVENPKLLESMLPAPAQLAAEATDGNTNAHSAIAAPKSNMLFFETIFNISNTPNESRHTPGANAAPAAPTYQHRASRPTMMRLPTAGIPAKANERDPHSGSSPTFHRGRALTDSHKRSSAGRKDSAPTRSVILFASSRVNDRTPATWQTCRSVKPNLNAKTAAGGIIG